MELHGDIIYLMVVTVVLLVAPLERSLIMTHDNMIAKLSAIDFRAVGTVQTMDTGIEFDYVSSKGCGTCFGAMGSWPAYRLRGFDQKIWNELDDE